MTACPRPRRPSDRPACSESSPRNDAGLTVEMDAFDRRVRKAQVLELVFETQFFMSAADLVEDFGDTMLERDSSAAVSGSRSQGGTGLNC